MIFQSSGEVYAWSLGMRSLLDRVFTLDTKAPGSPALPPSAGHCAAVAVVVHRLTGAYFASAKVQGVSHWFNRLKVNEKLVDIDLTGDQFGLAPVQVGSEDFYPEIRIRHYKELNEETLARADVLLQRLRALVAL